MKRFTLGLLLLSLVCFTTGGCLGQAGSTHDLLTYDNVIAAAGETGKAIVAYDTAVQVLDAKRQEAMLKLLEQGIVDSLVGQVAPDEAAVIAAGAVGSLKTALANFRVEEQRRAILYEVAMDNLGYIVMICKQGKKFTVYRADISAQWKSYLESSMQNYITPMPED